MNACFAGSASCLRNTLLREAKSEFWPLAELCVKCQGFCLPLLSVPKWWLSTSRMMVSEAGCYKGGKL